MPDNNLTDNEIIKEIQGIRESMKRHIDLTNEMGQDLLRIDEEYTGGSKVWLTTDYFKKVVTHFCHSNYLVKCMELIFEYINRLQAENKRLSTLAELGIKRAKDYRAMRDRALKAEAENERLKESNRLLINNPVLDWQDDLENKIKAEAYKEFAELLFEKAERRNPKKEEYHYVLADDIVDLLKELVGEENVS